MFAEIAHSIDTSIIWYFVAINLCYILLIAASVRDIFDRYKETRWEDIDSLTHSNLMPPVTVIISAYNEEVGIINTVYSILGSQYDKLKIYIVNDGSTDKTLARLIETFKLVKITETIRLTIPIVSNIRGYYTCPDRPNLVVIDKTHSGKTDSLNIGLNACETPFFITLDADTILEPQAVTYLMFSALSNPHTIAEGGSIYILNGCDYKEGQLIKKKLSSEPLVAIQTCEYLRAFVFGRTGWKAFGGPLILSGALSLFERQAVMDVNGYVLNCPGEDMEIVMHLQQNLRANNYPCRIGYNFSACAWTFVPNTLIGLWAQRGRWHKGLIDSLWRHKRMCLNPKYGLVGLFTYPFQLLGEFLGPIVEFSGYCAVLLSLYFNVLDWKFALLFFSASWGLGMLITLSTALISLITFNKYERLRDLFYFLLLVTLENFGFRQFLVICRTSATISWLFSKLIVRKSAKRGRKKRQSYSWN